MAFDSLKRLFGKNSGPSAPPARVEAEKQDRGQLRGDSKAKSTPRGPSRRGQRHLRQGIEKVVYAELEKFLRKKPQAYRSDRLTLLEIADAILHEEIGVKRPPSLRAHHIFDMLVKKSGRTRSGVSGACSEWQGSFRNGNPVLTTINSQQEKRKIVDVRKYVLENPRKGRRRNFRSNPYNLCKNPRCVHAKHIEMRGLEREEKSGENHARAKFSDKLIRKIALEYNAGATAKELSKKHAMTMTYVEQIMRKEKRVEATRGIKIRGRFRSY